MGTRFHLGLGCVALVAALVGCGRAGQQAEQAAPDTTMINASAALVEAPAGSDSASATNTDTCQSARAHHFIGRLDDPAVRTALAAVIGKRAVRWIRPGTAVTQDFQADRLNVIVVEDGRIGSLRCG
ncbi:I78 family peptidase inhibitor [Novosphingobium sp.]|uniref:I78 family peptidase inhibitor n=1 Tax=Novosphingobium sp. TaxID=1874826 RepID=UPI0025CF060B|nr:I78 family peptidase inhibitor [Novosphingobium sp.]